MQHVHDTDVITREEMTELVAHMLARFDQLEQQVAEIPVLRQRLDAAETALAQRAAAMCALSSAFDGVVGALRRLSAES